MGLVTYVSILTMFFILILYVFAAYLFSCSMDGVYPLGWSGEKLFTFLNRLIPAYIVVTAFMVFVLLMLGESSIIINVLCFPLIFVYLYRWKLYGDLKRAGVPLK